MKNKRLMNANSLEERYRILEADSDTPPPPAAETNPKKEAEEKLKKLLEGLKTKLIEAGGTVQAEGKAKELLDKLDINTLYDELVKAENVTSEEKSGKILKAFGEGKVDVAPTTPEPSSEPEARRDGESPPASDTQPAAGAAAGADGDKPGEGPAAAGPAGSTPAGSTPAGATPSGGGGSAPQVVTGQPIQVLGTDVTPERGRVSGRKTSIQIDTELAVQLIDNPEFKKLISSGNADMHLAWDDDRLIAPLIGGN
jgi:hypothetical protein